VLNETKTEKKGNVEWQQIGQHQKNVVEQVLEQLYTRNIQSVIVEGGVYTAKSFIEASLVDEIRLITTPLLLKKGLATPTFSGLLKEESQIGTDKLQIFEMI
jgi:diaminohydroxyphosphoribosylaminopyrimidine deaminase/5-amino-6-(5-phosphoribosylamino)uracil reductase